jgi:hypothetical protein
MEGIMTSVSINAVGFCAHYSTVGDWAFDYALALSRQRSVQLNVFDFLTDPYDAADTGPDYLSPEERVALAVWRERELRLYYDERAGDYLDVGFRLCDDREWTELHRCLRVREFQVLVLGYVRPLGSFAGRPIEEFCDAFVCPVVLIGPEDAHELHFNPHAELISDQLMVPGYWCAGSRAGIAHA